MGKKGLNFVLTHYLKKNPSLIYVLLKTLITWPLAYCFLRNARFYTGNAWNLEYGFLKYLVIGVTLQLRPCN